MPASDKVIDAIVLKKTKLGESDVILEMMASDGSEVRAIAKGARKPKNAGSARLELLNTVHVVLATGKNLDIVKESRLLDGLQDIHHDPAAFAAAGVIAECSASCIQPDLSVGRLFDMTRAALVSLPGADEVNYPLIVAAYIYKMTALLGMRPSFAECAVCGDGLTLTGGDSYRFSYSDGGAVCPTCAQHADTVRTNSGTLMLSDALFHMRFADIASGSAQGDAWDVLNLAESWFIHQTGFRLKSISTFKSICAYTSLGE